VLAALFMARVAGQALVAFFGVTWLPAMERWYSGVVPYDYLLASQILIVGLMIKICIDFTRARGYFYAPNRFFARPWLVFGYLYLGAMLLRAVLVMDRPIPIVFHWVLAAFILIVGESHRRRLKGMTRIP
jgi:hypothetical protein